MSYIHDSARYLMLIITCIFKLSLHYIIAYTTKLSIIVFYNVCIPVSFFFHTDKSCWFVDTKLATIGANFIM